MESKHLTSGKRQLSKQGAEEVVATQVMLGDLIWVRLNSGSGWPAQVVNENCMIGSTRSGNKSAKEVPVRLYGSYTYLYVDPVKCHSEFKRILEQNNGSYRETFENALAQKRPHQKSGRSNRQGAKSKANVRISSSRSKTNQNQVKDQDKEASIDLPAITQKTRVKKGNSKKAEEQKSEASNQDGMRKNLNPCRSSSEEKEAVQIAPQQGTLQSKLERGRSSGENKGSKQNVMQKKLKLGSPRDELTSRRAKEEARMKISKQDGAWKSLTRKRSNSDKQLGDEAHAQDGMQKKLKRQSKSAEKESNFQSPHRHGPRLEQESKGESSMQGRLHKKLKLDSSNTKEEVKTQGSKQVEVHIPYALSKKLLLAHVKKFYETTLFGKSPELSARRARVMQSLGLIAPSGSPFNKHGHLYLRLC